MKEYITDFKYTGECAVNVDSICKDWNDLFNIFTWLNMNDITEYTLVIYKKNKRGIKTKVRISELQALEIINKLKLIHKLDSTFLRGGVYRKN